MSSDELPNNQNALSSKETIEENQSDNLNLEEQESLDWAKQAFEKLKQKQLEKKEALFKESNSLAQVTEETQETNNLQLKNKINNVDKDDCLNDSSKDILKDIEDSGLGEFDDSFTWSAGVLAAQGKEPDSISLEDIDWLKRLRQGLEKTRKGFVTDLLEKFGDDPLTPEVLDDLEALLLRADVGVNATDQIITALRRRLNEEVLDSKEGFRFLKQQLCQIVNKPIKNSNQEVLAPKHKSLNIWLLVGVNGVGKTTTLGKLAHLALRSGYTALIAAADTFRAAAVQQVQIWGRRSGVSVIANETPNADPAAIVFDAIGAAKSKEIELLLVDTAGRLQTKNNLMEELAKIRRIIDRLAPEAIVESLLVLDASQGQNGLNQAMSFAESANLTGVVITKLDGSSRGGVAFAVASEAKLPIRFIGAGERLQDLKPFNSFEFVEALLANR
ncbi:signal recognition particle-docking protein FtsY [Prochlorococcus marinus]|uniref:Signal recognition particle receptor FtsY n=1 Tax=Prochlorococcus marinus (strain MIT 9211) TaxID=93059 RepID=A9B9K7_PROM4|nr:signal recognition particle-docking protein FtsY [Prochlorococcus marinus]ABX07940.1 signal recognition particle docking protein FtsY [Prochlorococcus marinus str. MIT 9211]